MSNPIRYIRTPEAAKYLGVSKSFLDQERVYGRHKLPFVRIGHNVVYDIADLDAWMAARKVVNTTQADALENSKLAFKPSIDSGPAAAK